MHACADTGENCSGALERYDPESPSEAVSASAAMPAPTASALESVFQKMADVDLVGDAINSRTTCWMTEAPTTAARSAACPGACRPRPRTMPDWCCERPCADPALTLQVPPAMATLPPQAAVPCRRSSWQQGVYPTPARVTSADVWARLRALLLRLCCLDHACVDHALCRAVTAATDRCMPVTGSRQLTREEKACLVQEMKLLITFRGCLFEQDDIDGLKEANNVCGKTVKRIMSLLNRAYNLSDKASDLGPWEPSGGCAVTDRTRSRNGGDAAQAAVTPAVLPPANARSACAAGSGPPVSMPQVPEPCAAAAASDAVALCGSGTPPLGMDHTPAAWADAFDFRRFQSLLDPSAAAGFAEAAAKSSGARGDDGTSAAGLKHTGAPPTTVRTSGRLTRSAAKALSRASSHETAGATPCT